MRILTISNYYPPYFIGGYELGCRDIMNLLRHRGHQVLVITSTHGLTNPTNESQEPGVRRQFQLEGEVPPFHPRRYFGEIRNRRVFRSALLDFCPDLVYFWNQTHLTGSLIRLARGARIPYAFYLSDASFLSWSVDSLWRRWVFPKSTEPLKAAVKSVADPLLSHMCLLEQHPRADYCFREFTSNFLRDLSPHSSQGDLDRVIPWGVDLARFPYCSDVNPRPTRILYVGQIERHKGTLTALRAIVILREQFGVDDVSLTVVGSGVQPDYQGEVQAFAASHLKGAVQFTGKVDRSSLPAIYQKHDILVFPSEWDEPFAITPLEAMASGLPIVATSTGGSKEIFKHGMNALVFAPGDPDACASAILELLENSALFHALRVEGRRLVEEKYSLERMVNAIEEHLQAVLALGCNPRVSCNRISNIVL